MAIKQLRQQAGMSQQKFGDYFNIPVRTIQNWEAGINQCAGYLVKLMEYKLKKEGIIQ
jgi:DNA-binding transcriptional regulator YiaG